MASVAPQTRQQQQLPSSRPAPSQIETITPSTAPSTQTQPQAVLRLRGAHAPTRRSVQWRSDVVDNEGLGRKKSKVCCIYHRPRAVDESSDDSSSSSDSSSDSDSDSESEGRKRGAGRDDDGEHKHGHGHGHDCDGHDDHHHHHHASNGRGRDDGKRRRKRTPSPNAYEKMPRYDNKPGKDGAGDEDGKRGGESGGQQRA